MHNRCPNTIYGFLCLLAVLTSSCSVAKSQQRSAPEPVQETAIPTGTTVHPDQDKPLDQFLGVHNPYLKHELATNKDAVETILKAMYDPTQFHETHVSVCALCNQKSHIKHQQFCDLIKKYGIGTRRYGSWQEEPIYGYKRKVSRADYVLGSVMMAIAAVPAFRDLLVEKVVVKTKQSNFQAEPFNFQRCVSCTTEKDLRAFAQAIDDNRDAIAQVEAALVKKRLSAAKEKPGFSFFIDQFI